MDEPTTGTPQAVLASTGKDWGAETEADAFGALADERRLAVLRALLAAEREGRAVSFSELSEVTGADTTAEFAYHLRQLTGQFVRKTESGYELTAAGRRVARATAGEEWFEGLSLDDDCPFCGEVALTTGRRGGEVRVVCGSCERRVVELPLPPQQIGSNGRSAS